MSKTIGNNSPVRDGIPKHTKADPEFRQGRLFFFGKEEAVKVKVKGGWKIRSHKTGKLWPKVYKTESEVNRRLRQLEAYKKR